MRMRFIDVDGIRTRCLMAGGEGAYPLLLLHGYGGTADVWIRNIDALADEFFVVAPDMISSGFTDPVYTGGGPPQPVTVTHLVKLADKLGFRRFCPMGTSYGSLIAALLYFALPDRVDRLVITGSGSCFNDEDQLVVALRRVRETFGPLLAAPSVEGCRQSMVAQCYAAASVPEEILPIMATAYAQPWMKGAWERGLDGLLDLWASRPYRITDRLEQLDVETLVVWGREDRGAIYENAIAAVKRMPRAELVTFEHCGHKPIFEHAERFNTTVRAFLRRPAGTAPAQGTLATA